MNVGDILGDIKKAMDEIPESSAFGVAFVEYTDEECRTIEIKDIEAFHWDDDDEFFLVPTGVAKHYDLTARTYSVKRFHDELAQLVPEVLEYTAYARARVKVAEDGRVISLNSPLWGTGYHIKEKLVYFYHGRQKVT